MGRLVIAHHKSYHPYRRDNIERVRKDEEEARQKEAKEEGRMMLAVLQQPFIHQSNTHFSRNQGFGGSYRPIARTRGRSAERKERFIVCVGSRGFSAADSFILNPTPHQFL
jgi:hypothetical protein